MARFLHEYAGTNWIGWAIIVAILSLPFLWGRARDLSIVWHQMANVVLAFFVGVSFSGTAHSMTGDDAMAFSVLHGFGVGYSLLAFRKHSAFERVLGVTFLLFFGSLTALLIWRRLAVTE